MKKENLNYDLLKKWNISYEIGEDGQPIIYQKKTWWKVKKEGDGVGWNGGGSRWKEVRKQYTTKTITPYRVINLMFEDGVKLHTVQDIVYILSHPEDSLKGFDVDHIDNNSLNNNPENLQLLSRKDNNRKKKHQGNQYCNKKNNYEKLK